MFSFAKGKNTKAQMIRTLRYCLLIFCYSYGIVYLNITKVSAQNTFQESSARLGLVADNITVDNKGRFVADGNVEMILSDKSDQFIRASKITYDPKTKQVYIIGPITLRLENKTDIIATQGELSSDFKDGILNKVRVLLDEHWQIAANEVERNSATQTLTASDVIASPCRVCDANSTPLWEIRAREAIHDGKKKYIRFNNASFRLLGVPIFYLPQIHIPSPEVKRAQGFLPLRVNKVGDVGIGVMLPYFIPIGPSRDFTITPSVTTKSAAIIQFRYRQAFRRGDIALTSTFSQDRLKPRKLRYILAIDGRFNLPYSFKLDFHGNKISDPDYLEDYGHKTPDRRYNQVELTRVQKNENIRLRWLGIGSLRSDIDRFHQLDRLSSFSYKKRFPKKIFTGNFELAFEFSDFRRSQRRVPLVPILSNGLRNPDATRTSAQLSWRKNWLLPKGIIGTLLLDTSADHYNIRQALGIDGNHTNFGAGAAAELRWPFEAKSDFGVYHVLEPIIQIVPGRQGNKSILTEDARLAEFDEGNFLLLNRFSQKDEQDPGGYVNIGLSYIGTSLLGTTFSTSLARVLQFKGIKILSGGSGLAGVRSSWISSTRLGIPIAKSVHTDIIARMLIDNRGNLSKLESRFITGYKRFELSGAYISIKANEEQAIPQNISSVDFTADYTISDHWKISSENRYNFRTKTLEKRALKVIYSASCISGDFGLKQEIKSRTNQKRETELSLNINIDALSEKKPSARMKGCGI